MNIHQYINSIIKVCLTVCMLASFAETPAQILLIKGQVVDSVTNNPIAFAHVYLDKTPVGTVSNRAGFFELSLPPGSAEEFIVVSFLGYRDVRVSVGSLEAGLGHVFRMKESPTLLEEIQITDVMLTAEVVLQRAITNLAENGNYPVEPFKLEGFFRETHQNNDQDITLVEAAFSVYERECTRPMDDIVIEQFRKVTDPRFEEVRKKERTLFNNNHLAMLLGISTNFTVLANHGLKSGGTAWAVGKRPYEIETITTYGNRPVYQITHTNPHVSLSIVIDIDNYSVMRSEYKTVQPEDSVSAYFWKYSISPSTVCGFYTTHQVYEYREYNGKMYPYFFYRTEGSKCFDKKAFTEVSHDIAEYQLLINSIVENLEKPPGITPLKKHKGMTEVDFKFDPTFWKSYNIIEDLPKDFKDKSIEIGKPEY